MKRFLLGSVAPVWEGEGGGAGGGAGGAGAGGGAGEWKAPEGLPPELVGKDASETLGKVWAGYGELSSRAEGLRTQLAQRPGPGKSPDEYTFLPDEALKPYFPDVAKDPILPFAREAFHKAGVPAAAFQPIISEIYNKAIAAGVLQAPYSPAAEIQTFMEKSGVADKAMAQQQLGEAEQFATGLAKQLQVPQGMEKDAEAVLVALTDTAAGNIVLRSLMARLKTSGINIPLDSTAVNNGPPSEDELNSLGADPRIDPRNRNHSDPNQRFDEALRKRYDEGMAARGRARNSKR